MRRSEFANRRRLVDDQEQDPPTDHQGSRTVWDCGSPLYDSYELAALNRLLERHSMISPSSCRSARMIMVVPSEKAGPDNGKGEAAGASPASSTIVSSARSFGRRLWRRVARKVRRGGRRLQ